MRSAKIACVLLLVAACSRASVIIGNPTFSDPDLNGAYEYRPSGAGVDWSFSGSTGIASVAGIGTGFNLVSAPTIQVGVIQEQPNQYGPPVISQNLTGLTVGDTYQISFMSATRPDVGLPPDYYGGGEAFDVVFNAPIGPIDLGEFLPTSTTFSGYVTAAFTATTSSGVLSFDGVDPDGMDRAAFLTDVEIVQLQPGTTLQMQSDVVPEIQPAPEPSNAFMVLSGLAVIGFGLRRKLRLA